MTGTKSIAVDIGSTVVKVAQIDEYGTILSQEFHPRDFEIGIACQVESLLASLGLESDADGVVVCSSANGGLRVGIVSLTEHYSGAALRNQVLSAGANPIFVDCLDSQALRIDSVDVLIVGGGIDCPDADPMRSRLDRFSAAEYRYGALMYCGNRFIADDFRSRFPDAFIIENPMTNGLRATNNSVFGALRRAYLDDLVYKEGISELKGKLANGIRPTPEVVNRGFQRAVFNQSEITIAGPAILIDIGGATTDLHYTVEIVKDDSNDQPIPGASVARYVFTDLGVVFSRNSTLLRLCNNSRLLDFLRETNTPDLHDVYARLREGDFEPTAELLSYACLFLAMDRFIDGDGPGLPSADLRKVSQFILTGGAAQNLSEEMVVALLSLFFEGSGSEPTVLIDRKYRTWVDGIFWTGRQI